MRRMLPLLLLGLPGVALAQGTPPPGAATTAAPATPAAAAAPTPAAAPAGAPAPAPAPEPEEVPVAVLDAIFEGAREHFHDGDLAEAVAGFHEFLRKAPETDDRYEWSEHFMARALDALGYGHAAVEYHFNVISNRRVPRLLPESLSELERIARSRVHDRVLVEEDLLDDIEFPDHLPRRLNDFVHWVQGRRNLLRGNEAWAARSFGQIRGDGLYRMKAGMLKALWLIQRDRDAEALPLLEGLTTAEPEHSVDAVAEEVVRDDARETLARLVYGTGDHAAARERYATIVDPRHERAHLPLEKAWTLYYAHDWPKALGLLYALESPSFRDAFLPDKYLLRGIIYTNLCHFRAAQSAVEGFRERFGDSLAAIRRRDDLTTNGSLMRAALETARVKRLDTFLNSIRDERRRAAAESEWAGDPVAKHLEELYGLEEKEVRARWRDAIEVAFRDISAKLLDYEEQVNLLDYEVGIALYRRVKKGEQKAEAREALPPSIPMGGDSFYLRPGGEHWNDELHDYVVLIQDRCDAPTRWE